MRERLQRAVNRLMYGERDDPYAVISRLGGRLEATLKPREMLPTIVETVAQALKLPYVAIALKEKRSPAARKENGTIQAGERAGEHTGQEGFAVVAAYGLPVEYPPLVLPPSYAEQIIGELIFAPRARGEDFSAAGRRLLDT